MQAIYQNLVVMTFLHLTSLLLFFLSFSNCQILYSGTFNTIKPFTILDDQKTVELTNPHRANSKIKFFFKDGNITQVNHDKLSSWSFEMSDGPVDNTVKVQNQTHTENGTTQFDFLWYHIPHHIADPEICFQIGFNNASWFSTYLESSQPWPYNTGKPMTKSLPLITGSYGSNQFGPVIENIFFTSDGFALQFHSDYPAYLHRTADKHLCFTFRSIKEPKDRLNYTNMNFHIFAGENIRQIHKMIIGKYHRIRRVFNDQIPDERMFKQTILTIDTKGLNQAKVLEHAHELIARGLKNAQLVLENWEAHYGDLTFDKTRFHEPKTLVSELHKLGFLVKLTVSSFISQHSHNFKAHQNFLLKKGHQTHTFIWTNHGNGSLWNYFAYKTRNWLVKTLQNLREDLGFDSYRFIGGELGTYGLQDFVPANYHPENYGNIWSTVFIAVPEQVEHFPSRNSTGKLIEVDSGYAGQTWPVFIRLPNIELSWTALKSVIPTALTMGLANYNFLVAPSFKAPPNEELYIRWLQMATFFPAVQLPLAPWKISNKAAKVTNTFLALHLEHSTTIIAGAKKSTSEGRPLLRPLWYLAPEDSHTFALDDQFALGSDLIVAPVLTAGQTQRTVYLPTGKWIDAHGKSYTGPGNFTVQAPLEELPYFKRQM